jgi:hypothetical protein
MIAQTGLEIEALHYKLRRIIDLYLERTISFLNRLPCGRPHHVITGGCIAF